MMILLTSCVFSLIISLVLSQRSNQYYGHRVYRVVPKTDLHLDILRRLAEKVDMWKEPRAVHHPVDIMVDRKHEKRLLHQLKRQEMDFVVMVDDVGSLINAHHVTKRDVGEPSGAFQYGEYHDLLSIQQWMDKVAADHNTIVSVIEVTRSYQNRPIKLLKISTGETKKPKVWLDAGIHSREWVAPATLMWITNELLSKYGSDNAVTSLLTDMDWYILPVFNVDGYEYTWTTDRLWRKTLSANNGSSCLGCDPNRNWDYHWGEVGISWDPCSNTYPGSAPFSEVEVDKVVEYLRGLSDVKLYIAYHSYSQFYMLPSGYTTQLAADYNKLMRVCGRAVGAIKNVNNTDYICDSLYNLVGASSGSSVDYAYGALNITYSVGVELRDDGQYGFLLPPDQIIPTAQENFEALLVWAQAAAPCYCIV